MCSSRNLNEFGDDPMNRKELNDIIAEEKRIYAKYGNALQGFLHKKRYMIWKCLAYHRRAQYYQARVGDHSGLLRLCYLVAYYRSVRLKNIYGERSGVEIVSHCRLGRRFNIWHGGAVINGDAGDDCIIRGNCVIGFKSMDGREGAPVLGNHVEIGVGAVVIGGIRLADDCIVGANAVVTKSFSEKGTVLVGIPAKPLIKG